MERLYLRRETYFSILYDRQYNGPVMIGSPVGGTSIEDVAASTPELIFTEPIDIVEGIKQEQVDTMAINMGFKGDQAVQAATIMKQLYQTFLEKDATQIEINPFAETANGEVYVCDSKLNLMTTQNFVRRKSLDIAIDHKRTRVRWKLVNLILTTLVWKDPLAA